MTPEYKVSSALETELAVVAGALSSCEAAEAQAVDGTLHRRVRGINTWKAFGDEILEALSAQHHVVVRGMAHDPITLLLVAAAIGQRFRRYRATKVVKTFTLSPWTQSLSHTIAEGHFHTDLNTAPEPPHITAIQCVAPDPDAPNHGEVRVAVLQELLLYLERNGLHAALRFLCDEDVVMVSDSERDAWRGRIVGDGEIRFHPETLRAAGRRFQENNARVEEHLARIKEAALAVSEPIQLGRGDTLFVSNRRALHYRGACTVRFRSYPTDFESRVINVLHLMERVA